MYKASLDSSLLYPLQITENTAAWDTTNLCSVSINFWTMVLAIIVVSLKNITQIFSILWLKLLCECIENGPQDGQLSLQDGVLLLLFYAMIGRSSKNLRILSRHDKVNNQKSRKNDVTSLQLVEKIGRLQNFPQVKISSFWQWREV